MDFKTGADFIKHICPNKTLDCDLLLSFTNKKCIAGEKTPLCIMAANGHEKSLLRLLNNGATDVDEALVYAVCGNNFEIAKILVSHGADIKYNHGNILTISSNNNYLDIVKWAVENDAMGEDTSTYCIHTSLQYGYTDQLFYILDNHKKSIFYSMHYAADTGDLDLVKLLTNRYLDVAKEDRRMIILAAKGGYRNIFKYLLDLNIYSTSFIHSINSELYMINEINEMIASYEYFSSVKAIRA